MKVRALRGVCIGVDRHLKAGDTADLEPATTQFLKNIGAVEVVPDEPPESESVSAPAKTGKKEK
jgi:hypothetical protein